MILSSIWIDALEFENYGGFKAETQFVRSVGMGYLIACQVPGEPCDNASTTFKAEKSGKYRVFVRTKNWKLPEAPGKFKISVNGNELNNICGEMPNPNWYWDIAGDIDLKKGENSVSVVDKTGWFSRFSAIFITDDMNLTPSPEVERFLKLRAECKGISLKISPRKKFDIAIVGAGPGGVGTALSAARNGLKVALISGRPTVGGNASNEGTINLDGASSHHFGMHETGIANEIKATKEHFDCTIQKAMELLINAEKNIKLFKNELCIAAKAKDNKIISLTTVNTITLQKYTYKADLFADCSGDGWLGYYAGAAYRVGREANWEFDESLASQSPDLATMSGCICDYHPEMPKTRTFFAEDTGSPIKFKTPDWAIKFSEAEIPRRTPNNFKRAEWWVENSNYYDDLWNDEFARDEMIRLGVGYFGWLKNIYKEKEKTANYKLKYIALHNSKRESRRLIGDYILSEKDYTEGTTFEDVVTYCGWALDIHHPKGIYSGEDGPFLSNKAVPITPIPYRCLYSKNISNLFMAGRCISVSHVGLGSVRVEATIVTEGHVVGAAASLCKKHSITPRDIYKNKIKELQQLLIKQDLTIPGIKSEDGENIAPKCHIEATSFYKNFRQPLTYGFPGKWVGIKGEHFCGPDWKNKFKGAEYYKVYIKNTLKQNVIARLYDVDDNDNYFKKEEIKLTLTENFEGWLELPFSKTKKGKAFLVSLEPEDTIYWQQNAMCGFMLRHVFFDDKGTKHIDGTNAFTLDYHSDNFLITNGTPEKVINGNIRWSNNDCNCWISDVSIPLPQSIIFTLPEIKEISNIQITTDTDLIYPRFAFLPPSKTASTKDSYTQCTATDVDIYLLLDGKWKKVATKNGNYLRQIRFKFKKQKAEKVKITVNSASSKIAKIYEIRIYE